MGVGERVVCVFVWRVDTTTPQSHAAIACCLGTRPLTTSYSFMPAAWGCNQPLKSTRVLGSYCFQVASKHVGALQAFVAPAASAPHSSIQTTQRSFVCCTLCQGSGQGAFMSLCCTAWLYLAFAGPLCLARFGLLFPAFCSIIKAVNAERLVSTIGGLSAAWGACEGLPGRTQ